MYKVIFSLSLFLIVSISQAQFLQDDFENSPSALNWQPDDLILDTYYDNPLINEINPSLKVMRYHDVGGQFANVRFTFPYGISLFENQIFSLKIYVPSSGITGSQNNQISLKLQNAALPQPWSTQTEVIKDIVLDEWQEVTFDFVNDDWINLNSGSPQPIDRNDLSRVLLQVNGENNNDQVLAYIDDFLFNGEEVPMYNALVWNDEFDEDGPVDSEKWFHQTQLPNGNSWFNNEIQHYTNRIENSVVNNGVLSIVAIREPFFDQGVLKQFTSARLNSKFAFTYGKVEVRAKLPTGVGTWPAIWTLGKNINELGAYWQTQGFGTTPWPACGEIDIMEHWGDNQNFVQSATHTPSSFGATENHGGRLIETVSTEFHTYTLYWYPDKLVFTVGDVIHFVYQPEVLNAETWPFDEDQFLLLNFAIEPSIANNFMQGSMDVEYVRVYQEEGITTNISQQEQPKNIAKVFPNPTNDSFTLTLDESLLGSTFSLYNTQGKLLKSFQATNVQSNIGMQSFDSGLYLLKSNDSDLVFKIVKQ
jgi:beta-glucanase (GH16 family)